MNRREFFGRLAEGCQSKRQSPARQLVFIPQHRSRSDPRADFDYQRRCAGAHLRDPVLLIERKGHEITQKQAILFAASLYLRDFVMRYFTSSAQRPPKRACAREGREVKTKEHHKTQFALRMTFCDPQAVEVAQ
jgi:hypothetical protein